MIITSIVLGVMGLFLMLGLGRNLMKDYDMHALFAVLFFGLVIGLSFIPSITWGGFSFNVGAAVFYLGVIAMFFLRGRMTSQLTALAIALILGGLAYGATRLAAMTGNGFFGTTNYAYALIISLLAVLLTRNGKYSMIIAAEAMMILNLLVQIGGHISLGYGLDWSVVAFASAGIMYELLARLAVRPDKTAYFFEVGRLED